jgi:hypothetical protein
MSTINVSCTNYFCFKSGCAVGTMENLLVFYGDVVRDDVSGVDVSSCNTVNVVARDMVNISFSEVRRCIRAEFCHPCA